MLLNHNYDDLKKQMEGMSTLEKVSFLEKIKVKEKEFEELENILKKATLQRIREHGVKKFGWTNNEIFS